MLPVLLRRGQQEHRVVHRDREDHGEEEDRRPGVQEALRLEAEQPGAVAVLEDQAGDAERRGGREQVGEHAEQGDQGACSATSSSRKPSARTTPMTSGVAAAQRRLEVGVLGGGAADERARREVGAEPVDGLADGWVGRVGRRDGLDQRERPVAGRAGGHDRRDARVGLGDGRDRRGVGPRARRSAACRVRPGRTPAAPGRSRPARCRRWGGP